MEWIDSIREILKANSENRLVMFVGAGVSVNSKLPTWGNLVGDIAKKINYNKCAYCSREFTCFKNSICDNAFSQEDYLRIPEYFYQSDLSPDKAEYYGFLSEKLGNVESNPNVIDDEIIKVNPHHIITTNFDTLIEESEEFLANRYRVISCDNDLLSKSSDNYLIKMHGDINDLKNIVLKESDYLEYEQRHPLICAFIKSLLINHTFVFVGYSLNDNNLRLIMSWVNYYQKASNISTHTKHFLVYDKDVTPFETSRLLANNIHVVTISDITRIDSGKTDKLDSDIGKRLYQYIWYINHPEKIQERSDDPGRYDSLDSYRWISHEDLAYAYNLNMGRFYGTAIYLDSDNNDYSRIVNLINDETTKALDQFYRSGITVIVNRENEETTQRIRSGNSIIGDGGDIFRYYLNNQYDKIVETVHSIGDISEKIYYLSLLPDTQDDLRKLIEEEKENIRKNGTDYILVLLHYVRSYLSLKSFRELQEDTRDRINRLLNSPHPKYSNSIKLIKKLFSDTDPDIKRIQGILEKQERIFRYDKHHMIAGNSTLLINELQAYAYDIYFFIKRNYLPYDRFWEVRNYLSYYLMAVLCSYSPLPDTGFDSEFEFFFERSNYVLGEIELDMLVKYTTHDQLSAWLNKYHVSSLSVYERVNVSGKFINLLKSYIKFNNDAWLEYIYCFSLIIGKFQFGDCEKQEVVDSIAAFIPHILNDKKYLYMSLFLPVMRATIALKNSSESVNCMRVLEELLTEAVIEKFLNDNINTNQFSYVLRALWDKNRYSEILDRVMQYVDSIEDDGEKYRRIYLLRFILPIEQYRDFLTSRINSCPLDELYHLVLNDFIPYSDEIYERLIREIQDEAAIRAEHPNERSFPDWLASAINYCVLLKVNGKDLDLSRIREYMEYSDVLQFMLEPEAFDYEKVNTESRVWQRIICSDDYRQYFVDHRNDIFTRELRQELEFGFTTNDQNKIIYGVLGYERDNMS